MTQIEVYSHIENAKDREFAVKQDRNKLLQQGIGQDSKLIQELPLILVELSVYQVVFTERLVCYVIGLVLKLLKQRLIRGYMMFQVSLAI